MLSSFGSLHENQSVAFLNRKLNIKIANEPTNLFSQIIYDLKEECCVNNSRNKLCRVNKRDEKVNAQINKANLILKKFTELFRVIHNPQEIIKIKNELNALLKLSSKIVNSTNSKSQEVMFLEQYASYEQLLNLIDTSLPDNSKYNLNYLEHEFYLDILQTAYHERSFCMEISILVKQFFVLIAYVMHELSGIFLELYINPKFEKFFSPTEAIILTLVTTFLSGLLTVGLIHHFTNSLLKYYENKNEKKIEEKFQKFNNDLNKNINSIYPSLKKILLKNSEENSSQNLEISIPELMYSLHQIQNCQGALTEEQISVFEFKINFFKTLFQDENFINELNFVIKNQRKCFLKVLSVSDIIIFCLGDFFADTSGVYVTDKVEKSPLTNASLKWFLEISGTVVISMGIIALGIFIHFALKKLIENHDKKNIQIPNDKTRDFILQYLKNRQKVLKIKLEHVNKNKYQHALSSKILLELNAMQDQLNVMQNAVSQSNIEIHVDSNLGYLLA